MLEQLTPHPKVWRVRGMVRIARSLLIWLPYTLFLASIYSQNLFRGERLDMKKPYVYRQFVPLASEAITRLTHMAPDAAVVLVLVLCAAGFAIASYYLFVTFHEER